MSQHLTPDPDPDEYPGASLRVRVYDTDAKTITSYYWLAPLEEVELGIWDGVPTSMDLDDFGGFAAAGVILQAEPPTIDQLPISASGNRAIL